MKDEKIDTAEVKRENQRLREALNTLLDELEKKQNVGVDTERVKRDMPEAAGGVDPPWVRAGFDDKREWMAERELGGGVGGGSDESDDERRGSGEGRPGNR